MCLVANCEASGKQDPVPAKTKQVTVTELQVEEEEGAGGEAGGR